VQWAGLGLSLVGLGVLVEAIESRVGRDRATRSRGLMGPAPGMALLFLLFAATMSGFPGTSGFVGEDLVMQAPTGHELWFRTLLLVATALNGFTMLRVFAHTFMGPLWPDEIRGFPPLNTRERLVLGAIAAAMGLLVASPALVSPA
jgi:NADH:ubiquinone oxidoreductase subunit 4 (subunit M)